MFSYSNTVLVNHSLISNIRVLLGFVSFI